MIFEMRTYLMKPGDAHLYDVGAVHSPHPDPMQTIANTKPRGAPHLMVLAALRILRSASLSHSDARACQPSPEHHLSLL